MQISLDSKTNKKYRIRAFFIFICLLVFIVAPILIPQQKVSDGSKIGSSVDNGTATIYLESATYYKENNLLEVTFLSQGKEILNEKMDVSIVATNEKNKKYPINQEKINDNYTVVFITNVPKNFKQVKITLSNNGNSSDMFSSTLEPFLITTKNSLEETNFIARTAKDYEANYLEGLITIQEDYLQVINNEIKELNDQITEIEKSSSDVTANVELMTGTEKQKAMDKIKQNTSKINQIKNQITEKEKAKEEYQEKIDIVKNAK